MTAPTACVAAGMSYYVHAQLVRRTAVSNVKISGQKIPIRSDPIRQAPSSAPRQDITRARSIQQAAKYRNSPVLLDVAPVCIEPRQLHGHDNETSCFSGRI